MKNQKIMKVTVVVGVIAVILLGVTFALTSITTAGTKRQVITTGELDIILDEDDAINLTDAMPVYDEVGMIGDAFNFRLINKTPVSLSYTLKLVKVSTSNELSPEIVRYGLTKDGETTIDFLSTITDDIVDSGTISGNQTIEYSLRLWIDINVEDESLINGKTLSYRVDAEASDDLTEKWSANFGIDNSKANSPILTSGMIPVVYNEDTREWVKASTEQQKYYNYEKQIWANAVTVTEETRDLYMTLDVGEAIPISDINTMWVWIPRYEYMYTNLSHFNSSSESNNIPNAISINFIDSNQILASDSSVYKIPEAFTFGDEHLSGFWMGKFEITGSSLGCSNENCTDVNFTVLPNLASVRGRNVSSFFYAIRSMQNGSNANKYGFDIIGSGTMDVHMLKNTEWGIVAMLSQSMYGKFGNSDYEEDDKEVYQNKSRNFLTGNSNGTPSTSTTNQQVPYDTPHTGYGASTTGTIYGVYDMSGGAYERVMGNYNKISGSSTTDNSGFSGTNAPTSGAKSWPSNKYFDLYTSSNSKAGDAMLETRYWYNDGYSYARTEYPWIVRGGSYNSGTESGVFDGGMNSGNKAGTNTNFASRIAIKP